MNVSTEANPQDILSQHYNQANLYFQSGEFQKALDELDRAKQLAADDHQREHIETTIATVKQNMGQSAPVAETAPQEEPLDEASATPRNRPNSMLVLTVLVGLVCITPIAMKFIEIFSQPRPQSTAPVATETTTATEESTDATPAAAATENGEPTPEATAALIVNEEQPETVQNTQVASGRMMQINGNNVNMRAEASVNASRVATLAQGAAVEALAVAPVSADGFQWQQIKTTSGETGWIASRFLSATESAPTSAAAASVDASVTGAESSVAAAAPAANTEMQITGTGISVRTTPSTAGDRLISLTNTRVTVLQAKAVEADGYTWTKIRTQNGTEGWVAHQFLSP